jgi:hypothetical protein
MTDSMVVACLSGRQDAWHSVPGNGHVNDCLHERIARRGHQLGEFGVDLSCEGSLVG